MNCVIKGCAVFSDGTLKMKDIAVCGNRIIDIADDLSPNSGDVVFNFNNAVVFPGFVDVHVHLREPGFSYKETIASGTKAAARGGYTSVCAMPNLDPVPDNAENLAAEQKIIDDTAVISVYPYGSITKGEKGAELSDMEGMADGCIAFSDDGRGVQNGEMMLAAMKKAKELGKMIVAHCEVDELLKGGYIHDGEYARLHGHRGICSESEWKEIERDIALARETGCAFHVCHVSTKESVELIRKAKAEGLDVSGETAPHYLLLNDMMLKEEGRFKMNPPVRSEEDRLALIEGIKDGTIEIVATDHAPHSKEEKSKGLAQSSMGIVGIETAFPLLYTYLVKPGIITLDELVSLICINPARRFGLQSGLRAGMIADLTVFELDNEYEIDSNEFVSMGKATPFDGWKVFGKCLLTLSGGEIAWEDK